MKKKSFGLVLGLMPLSLWSQWDRPGNRPVPMVTTGVNVQSWSFEDAGRATQLVFPVTVLYPLRPGLYLSASNTPAMASYDSLRLSGLSDTWLRFTAVFGEERFLVSLGIGAPTGRTGLDDEEFGISQILGENVFHFRLPSYGQGFNTKLGVATAYPLNERMVLGAGVQYMLKTAYSPVKSLDISYRPGDEWSLFCGMDMKLGESGKWNTDIMFTHYAADRSDGDVVYQSGNKVLIGSTWTFRVKKNLVVTAFRWRQKGKNEYGPSLDSETKNSNGGQWEVEAAWQFREMKTTAFRLLAEGRLYEKNEYGSRGAALFGGGLGLVHRLSPGLSIALNAKAFSGTLRSQTNVQVSGIDAAGSLVWEIR